jgi:hypothetical protein
MGLLRPSRLAALAPQDEVRCGLQHPTLLILRCFRGSESLEGRTAPMQADVSKP